MILQALWQVLDPYVLWVILGSAVFGLFVGAVPGLTATMATALLVPVTFFMPPVPAIASIVTATAMAIFAGEDRHRRSGDDRRDGGHRRHEERHRHEEGRRHRRGKARN